MDRSEPQALHAGSLRLGEGRTGWVWVSFKNGNLKTNHWLLNAPLFLQDTQAPLYPTDLLKGKAKWKINMSVTV